MASAKKFLIFLLAALIATPVAVAQVGLLNGLLGLIHIDGVLCCSPNGKIDVINGTTTPFFPITLAACWENPCWPSSRSWKNGSREAVLDSNIEDEEPNVVDSAPPNDEYVAHDDLVGVDLSVESCVRFYDDVSLLMSLDPCLSRHSDLERLISLELLRIEDSCVETSESLGYLDTLIYPKAFLPNNK
ncbi:hypothetical protein RND71_001909 [Anisodus tanguticus]|uniref:Uncharacterized protein n=1 Tax=Anisodus tanguticus TaxID=243964 RepID=A0AAE1VSM3_9SOLA|nr:hypothetical protein RND71_001909 [Anisodus tanguticus]